MSCLHCLILSKKIASAFIPLDTLGSLSNLEQPVQEPVASQRATPVILLLCIPSCQAVPASSTRFYRIAIFVSEWCNLLLFFCGSVGRCFPAVHTCVRMDSWAAQWHATIHGRMLTV